MKLDQIRGNSSLTSQEVKKDSLVYLVKKFQELSQLLSAYGIQRDPMSDTCFHKLEHSPHSVLIETLQNVNTCLNTFKSAHLDGDASCNKRLIQHFMRLMPAHIPGDWEDVVKNDGKIVEAYCVSSLVQLFRNMEFFNFCHYTISDVFTTPFHILYSRTDEANFAIMSEIKRVINDQSETPTMLKIPDCLTKEAFSERRGLFNLKYYWGFKGYWGEDQINKKKPIIFDTIEANLIEVDEEVMAENEFPIRHISGSRLGVVNNNN